jgi:broad specificity phosphatase PhoE
MIPLGDAFGTNVIVENLLDEAGSSESPEAFVRRLVKFYDWWVQSPEKCVIACSHGDWIPEFVHHFTGKAIDIRKGDWIHLKLKGSRCLVVV